ncbi:DUF1652 domain-containing protein [Pseudomonas cichorii]|nr:DUF1652 domain-containing protein [Pseudomonas cichorii]MBX8511710.1 DUF1652 domain-containing protein [Pseudomonas cichorii]MBX8526516.1 DUF1652 domain-containing protein [Pseudomonas cichorii]MBX8544034.1 DUF1652 domain-containing protein [Pseudomonas cichorii]MBX8561617.1 DUF1652 domain-containing protein [Pseudomonas cichorii]MBX8571679.1 DUF1652 domain-containing protein [Pseudomonas cichorii]
MLSHLELRHVMEVAFRPTICKCTISPDGLMSIELRNPETHILELTMTGIPTAKLSGGRAIAALVGEIKDEARRAKAVDKDEIKRQG